MTVYELPERPELTLVGPGDDNFWRMLGLPADGRHALVIGSVSHPTAVTVLAGTRPQIYHYLNEHNTSLRVQATSLALELGRAFTDAERTEAYPPVAPPPAPKPDPIAGLTTLPHSKVKVPHTRLTVTGYKGHNTGDGVAFTTKLRLDNKIVGTIENSGTGGATSFYPAGVSEFGWRDMEAFAKQSRDDNDFHVEVENVLDALLDEYRGAKDVLSAIKKGQAPIRQITTYTDSAIWYVSRSGGISATAGHDPLVLAKNIVWRQMQNELLLRQFGKSTNEHWEVWSGEAWERMAPAAA